MWKVDPINIWKHIIKSLHFIKCFIDTGIDRQTKETEERNPEIHLNACGNFIYEKSVRERWIF